MPKRKDFRKWAESINRCPRCFHQNLLKLGVDVCCFNCDWNSAQPYVGLGGMIGPQRAYWENFPLKTKNN